MKKFNKILSFPIRNGNPRGHTLLNKLTINRALKRQLQSFKQGGYTKVLHLAQISGKAAKKKYFILSILFMLPAQNQIPSCLLQRYTNPIVCNCKKSTYPKEHGYVSFLLMRKKNNESNFREFLKHCFTPGKK